MIDFLLKREGLYFHDVLVYALETCIPPTLVCLLLVSGSSLCSE